MQAHRSQGVNVLSARRYSRAYIRHLLKAKEMLGMRLCVHAQPGISIIQ